MKIYLVTFRPEALPEEFSLAFINPPTLKDLLKALSIYDKDDPHVLEVYRYLKEFTWKVPEAGQGMIIVPWQHKGYEIEGYTYIQEMAVVSN